MGRIVAQSAVLLSQDLGLALPYWRDVLGFSIDSTWGDPPGFAILKRDGAFVMIGASKAPFHPRRHLRESLFDAFFWVDDAASEFGTFRSRGAKIEYEPYLQPYGVLEFGILDRDDQLIGFGQVIG